MFDLGFQELIVIFIVALLVFGPKKLPELGRTLGKGIAEFKKIVGEFKGQITSEIDDIQDPIRKDIQEPMKKEYDDIKEKFIENESNESSIKAESNISKKDAEESKNEEATKG